MIAADGNSALKQVCAHAVNRLLNNPLTLAALPAALASPSRGRSAPQEQAKSPSQRGSLELPIR